MTTSQDFESFVPVFDVVPDQWDNAKPFLVETFRKISNAVNVREIGWYLEEELLSGGQFIPSPAPAGNQTPAQYRSIFRKVIITGPLVMGVNAGVPHGITFDASFTLVCMYCSATDSMGFNAIVINGNDVVMDSTDIVITSPGTFDRSFTIIEYILEV